MKANCKGNRENEKLLRRKIAFLALIETLLNQVLIFSVQRN